MTQLKGEVALAFHRQLRERAQQQRTARLQDAKAQAASSGKEAFDLGKLQTLYDTTQRGRWTDLAQQAMVYEYLYYVEYSQVPDLRAFARSLDEIDYWS
ncbi:hypothetical protein AVHY2522_10515 [Acidovorax sp. SUPP2522]|uniref:hypothetical protein n=1 Tax=unclassified Acidovorax TaxID=2684926 RepID=UPI00234BA71D|nr:MULTISPECIES: hypothetical protein [unclassified Acidovorax]WCN00111.1 hypothetical protein M5C96_12320 [Acidovorax sp. GBBC 1281]GKT16110.1 hypothetical protein AVHY2522_10515 [Acidovorax sp. SUPP2522]